MDDAANKLRRVAANTVGISAPVRQTLFGIAEHIEMVEGQVRILNRLTSLNLPQIHEDRLRAIEERQDHVESKLADVQRYTIVDVEMHISQTLKQWGIVPNNIRRV